MSTVAVFNGFGKYEMHNDGEKGITLYHGGVPFWFPFDKVTYLPDFTLREVDHKESSSDGDDEGVLTYKTIRISGERLAEELLDIERIGAGEPTSNQGRGIMRIDKSVPKRLPTYVDVFAGVDEEGRKQMVEVQEIQPNEFEVTEAHSRANAFKQNVINVYFQSKNERMAGGHGQLVPSGLVKIYMNELGIKDIDFVTKQLESAVQTPGITIEQITALIQSVLQAGHVLQPAAQVMPEQKPAEVAVPVSNKPISVSAQQAKKTTQTVEV